jgi:hypothetical protein
MDVISIMMVIMPLAMSFVINWDSAWWLFLFFLRSVFACSFIWELSGFYDCDGTVMRNLSLSDLISGEKRGQ